MNKINMLPTLKYFLICAFAWSIQYLFPNGFISLLAIVVLGFTAVNFLIIVLVLHEIPEPLLGIPANWGEVLSTNQEILLYQVFNLLILFSLTNDYLTLKRNRIILIRRSIPFFFVGGFFLYSSFVNYVIHADKHANNAKDDVQLLRSNALKVQEYIMDNGRLPTTKELYCEPITPCRNKIIDDYGKIFPNNNEYKLEIPRVRFLGNTVPFYRSTIYFITYDSKTNTTNCDHMTGRSWWIFCFILRAIFFLAFMVFPFTLELIKNIPKTLMRYYKVYFQH